MNILVIQGHPDRSAGRFCRALAGAYVAGARRAGHQVSIVDVAELDFPLLRGRKDWDSGEVPRDIQRAQDRIEAASHLAIFYPIWLGGMPALLKGFLEQALRPGFAFDGTGGSASSGVWERQLKGRSARVVVTMGMPALVYRLWYRAHSVKALERNILAFCGIGPIRETLIGNVEGCGKAARERWLEKLEELGRAAK